MSLRTDHQLPKMKQAIPTGMYILKLVSQRHCPSPPNPSRINALHQQGHSPLQPTASQHPSDKDSPDLSLNEDSSGFQEGGLGSDGDEVERAGHQPTLHLQKDFAFGYFPLCHDRIYT